MAKTVRKASVGKTAAAAISRAAPKAPAKARPASPVVAAKAAADPVQAKPAKSKSVAKPNKGADGEINAKAPAGAQPQPISGPTEVLGQVTWLMMNSPLHKHLFIADLEWLAAPPIMLKQFRIFRHSKVPIGYASWAFISEEAEQRLMSGARRLQPAEWNAGDRIWLMDLVAPFGGMENIIKELQINVFKNQSVKTLRLGPDGKGMQVTELGSVLNDQS